MRWLRHIAQFLSVVFYPLWMPTIGMVIFLIGITHVALPLPAIYWWMAILNTAILTAFVPLTAILIGIRRGHFSDIQIENASQRGMAYMYALVGFGFWCYCLIAILHVPMFLWVSAIGGTVAIACIALINRWWKISAHLCGWGGLTGGIWSFYLYYGLMPSIGNILLLVGLALLLMAVRIYVHAHDGLQVVAGYLVGLLFTIIPNILIQHYYV